MLLELLLAATLAPRVAILSVDGLRPDAISPTATPAIAALAARGAVACNARTILPSVTLPSHASMVSGVPPDRHGLTWNDYQPDRGFIRAPTVFTVAHAAGLRTIAVVGKEKLRHLAVPGSIDVFALEHGDAAIADRAIELAHTGFAVLFVHFPDGDACGHHDGWMSTTCSGTLAATDRAVGRLLAALGPQTTVLLSADHGGHGTTHGSDSPEDVTIPWILAGPGVGRGELQEPVSTMDTAATALHVLGLRLPGTPEGHVVRGAFAATSH